MYILKHFNWLATKAFAHGYINAVLEKEFSESMDKCSSIHGESWYQPPTIYKHIFKISQ